MTTPRVRIQLASRRIGKTAFVARCEDLLAGGASDPDLLVILGGDHATRLLEDGVPSGQRYWLRVWAARGLLWAGPTDDMAVLRAALTDDAWRVREMTCKVIGRHHLGDLLDDVAALELDPVARVRSAAARAVKRIVASDA